VRRAIACAPHLCVEHRPLCREPSLLHGRGRSLLILLRRRVLLQLLLRLRVQTLVRRSLAQVCRRPVVPSALQSSVVQRGGSTARGRRPGLLLAIALVVVVVASADVEQRVHTSTVTVWWRVDSQKCIHRVRVAVSHSQRRVAVSHSQLRVTVRNRRNLTEKCSNRARASCLPDSNPYGRDGLAHSRSLSTARRALRFT